MSTETRIACVTGSGRRLGRSLALALAEAGYDIVLHANTSTDALADIAAQIETLGRRVWTVHGDLSSIDDIRGIADEIRSSVPRLDLLVNNAGVFPVARFEDVTPEQWDLAQIVNTRAVFFLTQACAPMLRATHGAVVNIASGGAFAPWVTHIPYNVSKAGQVMLTRALAKALAPDVRVNAVAPGIILFPDEDEAQTVAAERIPMQRYATPADIASAVLFLAQGSQYITGHTLPVDGGSFDAT
ncbi:MAG: SDR family oxidoreductase [Ignavibacteriae bacterium]|nr:SDR family oxidoreductase [Ignavibacteriota bacterium]